MAERQQDHCWISHGGRRARDGKKEEVREREWRVVKKRGVPGWDGEETTAGPP